MKTNQKLNILTGLVIVLIVAVASLYVGLYNLSQDIKKSNEIAYNERQDIKERICNLDIEKCDDAEIIQKILDEKFYGNITYHCWVCDLEPWWNTSWIKENISKNCDICFEIVNMSFDAEGNLIAGDLSINECDCRTNWEIEKILENTSYPDREEYEIGGWYENTTVNIDDILVDNRTEVNLTMIIKQRCESICIKTYPIIGNLFGWCSQWGLRCHSEVD